MRYSRSPSTLASFGAAGTARDATTGDWTTFGAALSLAGAGIGTYHGYKQSESVGWAIVWGALGAVFPIFVIPIAIAQGLGQPGPGLQKG